MKTGENKSIVLALALLLYSNGLQAQGTVFTYPGRLRANGIPANGQHDFIFDLFDALAGGNTVAGGFSANNVPATNRTP